MLGSFVNAGSMLRNNLKGGTDIEPWVHPCICTGITKSSTFSSKYRAFRPHLLCCSSSRCFISDRFISHPSFTLYSSISIHGSSPNAHSSPILSLLFSFAWTQISFTYALHLFCSQRHLCADSCLQWVSPHSDRNSYISCT